MLLSGLRKVDARPRRTIVDWALEMGKLLRTRLRGGGKYRSGLR